MNRTTHVYIIFDESGSMGGKEKEVAQGFNAYVKDLKSDGGSYRLSATKFDTAFRPIFKDLPLADVPEMRTAADGGSIADATTYQPRGMTALLDAVGKSLTNTPALTGEDNALVVIFTDGAENSSHEWTAQTVKGLIQRLEGTGKWAFVYIGEDQSRWAAQASAASMGLGAHTVANTSSAMRGSTMSSLGSTTASYNAGATPAGAMGTQTQTGYDQRTQRSPVATPDKPEKPNTDAPWEP